MLIGLCGGELPSATKADNELIFPAIMLTGWIEGICAGKRSVAAYLIETHSFSELRLDRSCPVEHQTTDAKTANSGQSFSSIEFLLDFVTKNWQKRWLIADILNETVLEALLRRPFFLLVSIDAPVSLRWQRFKQK